MKRSRILKIAIPLVYTALIAGSIALMTVGDGGWGLLAFLLLVALIPVQVAIARDYLVGWRLLFCGEPAQAVPHLEAFLARIRGTPRLRHLIWIVWPTHTSSLEAMTLNLLGAAVMTMGELERSETLLREALAVDPRYPVPYYNLSLLAAHRGDPAEAERLREEAYRLGYPRDGEGTE